MARNNRFVNLNIFELVEDEEDDELFGTSRPYTIRVRRDHLDIWDDLDFRCRFRLKKETVIIIKQAIERRLQVTCNMYVF